MTRGIPDMTICLPHWTASRVKLSGDKKKRQFLILRKTYREWCGERGKGIITDTPPEAIQHVSQRWCNNTKSFCKLLMLCACIPAPAAEFPKDVCPQLSEPLDLVSTGFHYVKRNMLVLHTGLHLPKFFNWTALFKFTSPQSLWRGIRSIWLLIIYMF